MADVTLRLAVLLAAGVPPGAAWGYLGTSVSRESVAQQDDVTGAVVPAASDAGQRGGDVPIAIVAAADRATRRSRRASRAASALEVRSAWRALAAAVQVATESGAPLARSLRELASALRDLGQSQRDREAAMAGPRATARMVLALPAVGILFGVRLGFDTLHVLVATPMGLGCLAVGTVLLVAAGGWNRLLVRAATASERLPGLALELVAVAMSGGGSAPGAVRRVTDACTRFGLPPPAEDALASVLDLSQQAGVGAVELLRAEAEQARRDARSRAEAASAALGVRLMVPLGVCVLPAFMVLSVVPLVTSILSSTLRGI